MACVEFTNLCYTAGDTMTVGFQYLEDDGQTPIDLTGSVAQMQLLESITDVSNVTPLTGGITDPINGSGVFSLTDSETQSLLPIVANGPASVSFVSKMRFTFSDSTKQSVLGANITFEQSGIR